MFEAEKLFYSSPSHKINYYISAERMEHVPALKQPEVSGQLIKLLQSYGFVCVVFVFWMELEATGRLTLLTGESTKAPG